MACSMCTGTDCAPACDQGQCYAEEMRIRQALESDPGDGCLACGEQHCSCDVNYDESRDD